MRYLYLSICILLSGSLVGQDTIDTINLENDAILGKSYAVVKVEKGPDWSNADRVYTNLQISFKRDNIIEIIDNKGQLITGIYNHIDDEYYRGLSMSFGIFIDDTMTIVNDYFEYVLEEDALILTSKSKEVASTTIYLEENEIYVVDIPEKQSDIYVYVSEMPRFFGSKV